MKRILALLLLIILIIQPVSAGLFDFLIGNGIDNPEPTILIPSIKNIQFTKTEFRISLLKNSNIRVFNPDTKADITNFAASDAVDYIDIIAQKNGGNTAFTVGNELVIMRSRI